MCIRDRGIVVIGFDQIQRLDQGRIDVGPATRTQHVDLGKQLLALAPISTELVSWPAVKGQDVDFILLAKLYVICLLYPSRCV